MSMNEAQKARERLLTKYSGGSVDYGKYGKIILLGVAVFFLAELFQK